MQVKKITLSYDKCIGCGLCFYLNKNIFTIDKDGYCKLKKELIKKTEEKDVTKIINVCPTKALKIVKNN